MTWKIECYSGAADSWETRLEPVTYNIVEFDDLADAIITLVQWVREYDLPVGHVLNNNDDPIVAVTYWNPPDGVEHRVPSIIEVFWKIEGYETHLSFDQITKIFERAGVAL